MLMAQLKFDKRNDPDEETVKVNVQVNQQLSPSIRTKMAVNL